MQVLEKVKIVEKVNKKATFKILILKTRISKNSFNGKILGRKLEDWLVAACSGHDICIVDYDGKQNILEFVKNKIDKRYDYTMVLTSNIPLMTNTTINDIKEYCYYKNTSLCYF